MVRESSNSDLMKGKRTDSGSGSVHNQASHPRRRSPRPGSAVSRLIYISG